MLMATCIICGDKMGEMCKHCEFPHGVRIPENEIEKYVTKVTINFDKNLTWFNRKKELICLCNHCRRGLGVPIQMELKGDNQEDKNKYERMKTR